VAARPTPEITSSKQEIRKPRVSNGPVLLVGLAVGAVVMAWMPWQFGAIAVCILFVFALATYYGAKAKLPPKLPPERGAKVGEKKGDGAD
jgi:uncharacterized membrane protein YoaK (UPF0700 family)